MLENLTKYYINKHILKNNMFYFLANKEEIQMRRDKREAANKKGKIIKIIVLIVVIILMALLVWFKAPDYYVKEVKGKTNLVINNNNVTSKMKDDVYIDNKGVIYLSINDVRNYFDKYINYDENSNRLITTSDTKTATLIKDKKNIDINGATVSIAGTVIEKMEKYIFHFQNLHKMCITLRLNTKNPQIELL